MGAPVPKTGAQPGGRSPASPPPTSSRTGSPGTSTTFTARPAGSGGGGGGLGGAGGRRGPACRRELCSRQRAEQATFCRTTFQAGHFPSQRPRISLHFYFHSADGGGQLRAFPRDPAACKRAAEFSVQMACLMAQISFRLGCMAPGTEPRPRSMPPATPFHFDRAEAFLGSPPTRPEAVRGRRQAATSPPAGAGARRRRT